MDRGQYGNDAIFGNLGIDGRKLLAFGFYALTVWSVSGDISGSAVYWALIGVFVAIIAAKLEGSGGIIEGAIIVVPLIIVPSIMTAFVGSAEEFETITWAFFCSLLGTVSLPLRKSIKGKLWVTNRDYETTEWRVFEVPHQRVLMEKHPYTNATSIRLVAGRDWSSGHPRHNNRIELKVEVGSTWEDLWKASEICAWALRETERRYIRGFEPDEADPKVLNLIMSSRAHTYNIETRKWEECFGLDKI